jgi:hypothetical protein
VDKKRAKQSASFFEHVKAHLPTSQKEHASARPLSTDYFRRSSENPMISVPLTGIIDILSLS